MVNTHKKFPTDVKHNTHYEADGTDLQDATEEEIEKYRLAASHKRRKLAADAAHDKTEKKDFKGCDEKRDSSRSNKREMTKHHESPR